MKSLLMVALVLLLVGSSVADAQSINWNQPAAVVEAALATHPALARGRAEIEAARERAKSAGSLPNPMVMGGVQNQQVNLSNDPMMTMYMLGASQTFTRKSKREAFEQASEFRVRSLEQQLESLQAEVRRDTLFAWYEVAAVDGQIAATGQIDQLLEAMTDAARVRYEVGKTIQADVLRAQLERSDVAHQLLTLRGKRDASAARLLALLGLSATTEIPRLTMEHEMGSPASQQVINPEHPAIAALEAELQAREQEIHLARLAEKPDWNLEASYGLRTEQTDMFSVLARIEIPFRRKTLLEPRIREAIAQREAIRQQIELTRREIQQALGVAEAIRRESEEQIRLHQQVLVPQARTAFESTLAAYQTGQTPFDAVLSSEERYLRLEIDFYDFLARHLKAMAEVEAILAGARVGARTTTSSAPMSTM